MHSKGGGYCCAPPNYYFRPIIIMKLIYLRSQSDAVEVYLMHDITANAPINEGIMDLTSL